MSQRRPRHKQRPLAAQLNQIERRHRPARPAKQRHQPPRPQAVQRFVKGSLPHRVVHHIHPAPVSQPPRLRFEIRVVVQDDLARPSPARQLRLGFSGNRRNHPHPNRRSHLRQQQAHPASRRVHERRVPRLQRKSRVSQIVRRHPLQQHRRGLRQRHPRRHMHQLFGGHQRILRIAAQRGDGRHRVTHGKPLDSGPKPFYSPRALRTRRKRQRRLVPPLAKVNLNKVDAGGRNLDQNLPRAGRWDGQLSQSQYLRPACFVDLNSFHDTLRMHLETASRQAG